MVWWYEQAWAFFAFASLGLPLLVKEHKHFRQRIRVLSVGLEGKNMSTFQHLLVWYNSLDGGVFVSSVENLQRYYFEKDIDIFKVSISDPGLAWNMPFESGRQAGACFRLFDGKKFTYYTINNNTIGGPSIIFNRHHEVVIIVSLSESWIFKEKKKKN